MMPTMLAIMASGSITTTLVPAEARTATPTSEAPCPAASQRSSSSSNLETTFSSTTIELETSTPVERPMASRVTVLSDCPDRCMKKRLITTVTGIVMATITVVRMLTRKTKRIIAQSRIACQMLSTAELTESTTLADSSETQVSCMPPGSSRLSSSKRFCVSRTTATVLPSAFLTTLSTTPWRPSRIARWRTSSVAMRIRPRSPMRRRAPSRLTTSSSLMASTDEYSASKRTASSLPAWRMRPPGSERIAPCRAPATSRLVRPAAARASRSSSTHTSRSLPPIS